ncbi:hypothetical protein Sjap_001357 [Stephania japonica]|uniref:KOW domain-containing protein n=1 Tax=Stephania japonica TaxID=461633 RepID=A0AAP0PRL3_9MAGN
MALKGKEVAAGKAPAVKRKKESAGRSDVRKRRNPGVLQFFDVVADERGKEEDESEGEEFDEDFIDDSRADSNDKNGLAKGYELPILPKEEELSGDELEKYLEERYKTGSHHVKYAGDESELVDDKDSIMPSKNDPTIWRIKCMVGRERQIVFSLMHKFVNLHSLGSKLKIVSAFALEHTKGFVYMEAEKQSDVLEACKGLCNIYFSRISPVPNNEVSRLISVQSTKPKPEVPKLMWVRLKHGKYKGDLAQVVSVEEAQKRATVKLLPRIDVLALAKKLAGGGTVLEAKAPAPRIISSSDLEDIRRHIKSKRDRQTGEVFETVDGLTLKDGYLYKKVSVQSLKYLTELPSAEELEKFNPSNEDKSDDMEWLSQLYGEKRKCSSESSERTSKGESTSGTKKHSSKSMKATTNALEDALEPKEGNGFQLHNLVFFGENDFGVIIGMDDDRFQILKDDVEGAKVVNIDLHEMKSVSLDKKFSTFGKDMIKLSLNDVVRVLEGPSEGKQGVIKHICQETVFIFDEHQLENGGYFCANSQSCENISNCEDSRVENDGDRSGFPTSEDFAASLEPEPEPEPPSKKRWEKNTFNSNNGGNKDCNFSIGQTLRIRVGPLKGHICRVVAIYRSDVTVRLDTQIKVITVKSEHLSVAGVKAIGNPESNSMGSFDGFATGLSGATTNDGGWNSGTLTGRRNPWPNFSSSDFLADATAENPSSSNDPDKGEDKGDDPWGSKTTTKKVTDNWGQATGAGVDNTVENKANQGDGWDRAADKVDSGGPADQWGSAKLPTGEQSTWNGGGGGWDIGKLKTGNSADEKVSDWGEPSSNRNEPMDKGKGVVGDEASGWNQAKPSDEGQWRKGGGSDGSGTKGWGSDGSGTKGWGTGSERWDKPKVSDAGNDQSWNRGTGKSVEQSSWGKAVESSVVGDEASGWNKAKPSDEGQWRKGGGSDGSGTKGWGTGSESWDKPKVSDAGNDQSWNRGTGKSVEQSSWGKAVESSVVGDEASGWNQAKPSDEGQWRKGGGSDGSGTKGWGTGSESWDKPKVSDAGNDQSWNSGTGKSVEQSSWGKAVESSKATDAPSEKAGGNNNSWNNANSFNAGASSGWKTKANDNGNSLEPGNKQSSGWNNSTGSNSSSLAGNQSSGWDGSWSKPKSNNQSSGWGGGRESIADSFNANESSGWKTKVDDNVNSSGPGGNETSGWNGKGSSWDNSSGGKSSSLGGNQSSGGDGNWSSPKTNNQSSGWGGGSAANDKPKWGSDDVNGLNRKDKSNADQVGSWNAGAKDSDGSKSSWSSLKDSGGTQSSSWGQKPASKEGTEGMKDQEGGWNKGNTSNTGWGSGQNDKGDAAGWGSGSNFGGGQSSGWGRKGNEGGNESQSDTWNKKAFGNNDDNGGNSGGNWRGGGGSSGWNKESSDNIGDDQVHSSYGDGNFGRGRSSFSDRGGFRGRGRRGGGRFGGRNGGGDYGDKTDDTGDGGFGKGRWQDSNDSGKGQWQQGSDNVTGSWVDGDSGKGQWQRGGNRGGGRFGGRGRGRGQDDSENNDSSNGQWQQGAATVLEVGVMETLARVGGRGVATGGGGRFGGRGRGRGQDSSENNDSSNGQWQQGGSNSFGSWGDGDSGKGGWQKGGDWGGGRSGGRGWGQDSSENNDSSNGQWQQGGSNNSFGSWGDGDSGKGGWQRGGGNRGGGRFGGRGRGRDYGENNDSSQGQWQQGSNDDSTRSWGDGGSSRGRGRGGNRGGGRFGGRNRGQDYSEKTDDMGDGGFGKGEWQQGSNSNVGNWGDGSSSKGQWQKDSNSNAGSWGQEGSTWGQQKQSGKSEGWSSGWSKGNDTGNEPSSVDHGSNWKQPQTPGASGWSSLATKGTDSASDAAGGWNKGSNAGNRDGWSKSNDSAGDAGGGWNKSSNAGNSSGWSKPNDSKNEGWGSGSNKGKDTSNGPGSADHGTNWKQPQASGASGWSGVTKGTDSAGTAGGGWNNASNAGNNDGWSKPNAPVASSSGWNKTTDSEEANADAGQAKNSWEKAPSGASWGKQGW